MKIKYTLGIICFFGTGCAAHAHTPPPVASGPSIEVTLGWTWVKAGWHRGKWHKAHWTHPHHGKAYRKFHQGPPPVRPHAHSVWIPGHYEGRGHRRHWVPGHWKKK